MVSDWKSDVGCDKAATAAERWSAAVVTPVTVRVQQRRWDCARGLACPTLRGTTALLVLTIFAETAWADVAPPPLIKRLDDATRAKVLAALAGLIILGFAMVWLTWLGARVVQRYRQGTSYHSPTPRPGEHDWARRPLAGSEPDEPPVDP